MDGAADSRRESVTTTPPGHPELARRLANLGDALLAQFELSADADDLQAALDCCRQASREPLAAPVTRLIAATNWGDSAAKVGQVHEAAEAYATVVGLLPVVTWHGLDRLAREEQLARWAGLTGDAAAYAIMDGHPERAVELLKQGRSVIWRQALNLRADLGSLAGLVPVLAERLDSLRSVLEDPVSATTFSIGESADPGIPRTASASEMRRRKAREWD